MDWYSFFFNPHPKISVSLIFTESVREEEREGWGEERETEKERGMEGRKGEIWIGCLPCALTTSEHLLPGYQSEDSKEE